MNKKIKAPKYIKDFLKKNPKVASGRKNFDGHHVRIVKTLDLIKNYFNKN